ncbi:MAG TPA: hypothetical protein VJS19_04775 [Candidatus Dormibacteraeota bacterium]|nr:hypothetical protein [Candidatus Dormibacteraeota bacterium]
MIDHTSTRIEERQTEIVRENRRRYAFHRMLQATDRMLWRLEEMNRDGIMVMPRAALTEMRGLSRMLPSRARESLRETADVQDALDSLFEVQEQLFRWRFPNWHDWDPDAEAGPVAS